eukprot:2775354-Amphidinium_carterae.1
MSELLKEDLSEVSSAVVAEEVPPTLFNTPSCPPRTPDDAGYCEKWPYVHLAMLTCGRRLCSPRLCPNSAQ